MPEPDGSDVLCPEWRSEDLISRLTEKKTLATFHDHKAPSAIGWTQSLCRSLADSACLALPLQQLTLQITLGEIDATLTHVILTSRIVGLHKGDSGSLRPLSLPIVLRKASDSWVFESFFSEVTQFLGQQQYGTGMQHGCVLFSHSACKKTLPCTQTVYTYIWILRMFSHLYPANARSMLVLRLHRP